MPNCNYKRCQKTAEVRLGKINTNDDEHNGLPYPASVYVCKKHAKKILKKLHLKPYWEEEE